ncbi:YfcC family protein [Paucisalibacillus sp. EB02]|uniref:YfcC family protein n=1 Tax=Paucisalibacillus sp. EB02 TaxID=1347087 RepID=UPI0005A9DE30|nr:TIGR00366 family protein [Paucisalibacillus sp. EB02]
MAIAAKKELEGQNKKKKRFSSPHPFIILFSVIVLTAISTYFIPAGQFERTTNEVGQTIVVEDTYQTVESNPTGLLEIFQAVPKGMVEGASIIFFIFIVGGAFNIFRATNAIEGALGSISSKVSGKEIYIIPVVMLFFGLAGASFGMFEEAFPFILVLVPIAIKLGFDSIVGAAMVLVGVSAGFTAAFSNPFTIGVAQGIAELPIFSGMTLRIIYWLLFMAVSIAFVMRYAHKVKKDPTKSIMYKEGKVTSTETEVEKQEKLTKTQAVILGVLLLTLVVLAYGVLEYGWYIIEIAALFLIFGIVVGLINRMKINEIAENFVRGCKELVVGALVVGFAYGVLVLLQDSNTIDTILYGITNAISGMPSELAALGMYVMQGLMNFIVTSGSGQAALTMPIMTPLADLLDVNRQTAVLAFQMGDGISNIFAPTSGLLLAGIAMAGISYGKWFKWIWPLILIHYVMGAIFVTIAHMFVWV